MQSAKSKTLLEVLTILFLTKLAKAILVVPHGNADTERLFSHLGLNKTKAKGEKHAASPSLH